eukprot:TRINITY_DN8762_c0_g1_i1.p4 TRINITY_DN8762_c0_g1~~TRINITY_DN8762_c0_g1_i1.p4  ORF type:complete len:161 (+),score=12.17 TRINITY_DN8762_c0_g1_i1:345-827(+)
MLIFFSLFYELQYALALVFFLLQLVLLLVVQLSLIQKNNYQNNNFFQLKREFQSASSSLAQVVYNIGYFLSPLICGIIIDSFHDENDGMIWGLFLQFKFECDKKESLFHGKKLFFYHYFFLLFTQIMFLKFQNQFIYRIHQHFLFFTCIISIQNFLKRTS